MHFNISLIANRETLSEDEENGDFGDDNEEKETPSTVT
jgi:hypothetical protein